MQIHNIRCQPFIKIEVTIMSIYYIFDAVLNFFIKIYHGSIYLMCFVCEIVILSIFMAIYTSNLDSTKTRLCII